MVQVYRIFIPWCNTRPLLLGVQLLILYRTQFALLPLSMSGSCLIRVLVLSRVSWHVSFRLVAATMFMTRMTSFLYPQTHTGGQRMYSPTVSPLRLLGPDHVVSIHLEQLGEEDWFHVVLDGGDVFGEAPCPVLF